MFSSIRMRLIVICVAIVALAMLVLTGANFLKVRSDTYQALDEEMGQLADSRADNISEWLRAKRTIASSMKLAVDQSDPLPFVKAAMAAGSFDDAYIGVPGTPGFFVHPMPEGYVASKRPWYIQADQAGTAVLTLPYADATTKKLVVTFAEPIGPKGAATAVVGADVQLDNVVRNVTSIKPTPSSYAFLIDRSGIVITHPKQELALKQVSEVDPSLSAAMLLDLEQKKQGGSARIAGKDDMLFVKQVAGSDWFLVLCLDRAEATASINSVIKVSATATIAMILIAAFLLTAAITGILHRLKLVRDALEDISSGDGDLTRRLSAEGKDELAQIAGAFNRFTDKIASVLREIRQASESVKVSSNEIAVGNLDLSNRTEQQAGSLEETASAMEQLTSTVKQNADNARAASQLAISASTIATEGGSVVGQVVDTMSAINDSSKKIVEIISVIDGIAFQTNILALNAAVEAARAGEQGRGFAVVASEVRSLAQRSAAAAKEINALISDSVEKVEIGSKLVGQAGGTMGEIVSSVKRVTDIVSEISAAGQEQSSGIEEVNRAIVQMDEATQQNAALVEQAAAAAASLQEQAVGLAHVVAGFRLDDEHAAAPSPGLAVAAPPRAPALNAGAAAGPAQRPAVKTTAVARTVKTVQTPKTMAEPASAPKATKQVSKPASENAADWEEF
ncbi:methyl-accepting chemotaxis protein [Oxalobacteraceae bacterium CAVE-383]|nr:methyl-accepting chemotaxis protein [Oxalobacteraceae bacterium CAVE-383]